MTTLLEQAFTAATKLSQERQDELAQLILQEISRPQRQNKKKLPMISSEDWKPEKSLADPY